VDILIEEQHRALAFIAACNNQSYRPTADQVEDWLDEPATATPYGLLRKWTVFSRGMVTEQLVRLGWVFEDVRNGELYILALGRALLRDADAKTAEVVAATTVVLDAKDPLAYAALMSELASAGAGLLVDPYVRREQLLHIVQDTKLERVLVGQNLKRSELDGLRAMLGYLPPGRRLELRIAEDAHDRYLKAEDGSVSIIGSSMGTVSGQKSTTVITPFPEDSHEMIGKMLEDRWDSAEPLRAEEPEVQGDEKEPPV
jgi:hypothetical protein